MVGSSAHLSDATNIVGIFQASEKLEIEQSATMAGTVLELLDVSHFLGYLHHSTVPKRWT